MSTVEKDRKKRYTKQEVREIIEYEQIETGEDYSFISALQTNPIIAVRPDTGEAVFGFLKTITVPVIETYNYPTGYFFEVGQSPVLIINPSTILDYDLVSEIHPTQDADIYLWTDIPWEMSDLAIDIYNEWYRREVYKDKIKPFDGKELEWEDLPPSNEEGEDS